MVVSRVTRVSNPRTRRRRVNPRKLSLKQKLHFGNPRQRAAAKAALRRKRSNPKRHATATRRRTVRASNPVRRRKRVARANPVRRRKRRSNPAHMVTLGLINPAPRRGSSKRRRKVNMAKTAKRRRRARAANPRRRRRNSVKVIVRRRNRSRRAVASNPVRRRRRTNPRHHRRRRSNPSGRRRNPTVFGHSVGLFDMAKIVAAGLAGVAITKAVPNLLPTGMLPASPITAALVAFGVAFAAGAAATALIKSDPMIGYAIGFGGFMQAGSLALNALVPQAGQYLSLSGLGTLGDLVPGRFPIPQNPIMAGVPQLPPPMPAGAASGVGAIYNPFGRAM